jgi:HAD superfamily hydrolase (TIGR01549 family)
MRNKATEYVATHFTSLQKETFNRELESFLRAYELDAARGSKLFPDTIPTLEKLKTKGLPLGMVTNTSREAVNTEFKLHDIDRYFTSVVTRERVAKLKPDPEGILLAARDLRATRIFMVGDLRIDLEAARAANAICIIVKRSHGDGLNLNPDYYVNSLGEIPAVLDKSLEEKRC